jgi:hypothetical protein
MASNLSLTIKYVQILCQHLPHDMTGLDASVQIEGKITNNVIYVIRYDQLVGNRFFYKVSQKSYFSDLN